MGCYGNKDVITPNLDQLAKEGMVFDNHYDTTAICMASRANIFTGKLEYKTGTNFEHGHMLENIWKQSYPILLRKAGYRTAFAGKFGLEVTNKPDGKGYLPEDHFDKWGGGPGQTNYVTAKNKSMAKYAKDYPHSTLSYAAFAKDFIAESTSKGQPFCLSISFKAPHRPVQPDPQFDHIYKDKVFKKPDNYGRKYSTHFSKQSKQGRQYERFESWDYDKDYDNVMAKYNQQIYAVDVAVKRIREALSKHNATKNTIIIFTSDNGFFNGSHGYGSKVLPYEEASRVPLIIYDPRHQNSGKQLRSSALTGNIDFAPTLLQLAGLPIPEDMDGKSILPLYDNPNQSIRKTLPLINVWGPAETHSFGILTKDFKYIFWNYAEGDFTETEELFHTTKDPLELKNEIQNPEYQKQLNNMRKHYDNAVSKWKNEAVPFHDYQRFSIIFDRNLAWSEKASHIKTKSTKKKSDTYLNFRLNLFPKRLQ